MLFEWQSCGVLTCFFGTLIVFASTLLIAATDIILPYDSVRAAQVGLLCMCCEVQSECHEHIRSIFGYI